MLGVFAIVVVIGSVIVLTRPETYRSQATFLLEEEAPRRAGGSPALSVLDQLGRSKTIETEMEILRSRRVLEPVVDELALHVVLLDGGDPERPRNVFSTFEVAREVVPGRYQVERRSPSGFRVRREELDESVAEGEWGQQVSFGGLTVTLTEEAGRREPLIEVFPFAAAVQQVRSRLAISASQDAAVIRLACDGPTAQLAHETCAAVSRSYMALRAELQRAQAAAAKEFLNEQVERIEGRLAAAEDSVETYARRNRVVALEAQAQGEVQRYAELRARSELMQSELDALTRLMDMIESEDPDTRDYRNFASFPTFITGQNRLVSGMVEQLIDLENQRSGLALRRTDTNPDMVSLDSRIRELENQLKSTTEAYAEALRSQVTSLDATLESMGRQLSRIPTQQVESARLERQVALLEDLYGFLQTRLQEAEVAQGVNLPSIRVIDEASFPLSPNGRSRRLSFGLIFMVGIAAAFVSGLAQEYLDTRLREPEEVERRTGVPVLTVVPRVRVKLSAPELGGGNGRTLQPARTGRSTEDWNAAVEAFRSLVLELRFAGEQLHDGELRLVAVTSAARGEGKTFTACNLALASAMQGRETLLVDADLRALGASRMLNVSSEVGLGDVLEGRVAALDACQRLEVGEGALHVLPGGRSEGMSPTALLTSDRLGDVISELRNDFDLVVVDTPPLNLISDAATVSSRVDAVLVVVRGGVTQREGLKLTLDRLQRARAFIAGIVLNDIHMPDYYYTHYS